MHTDDFQIVAFKPSNWLGGTCATKAAPAEEIMM